MPPLPNCGIGGADPLVRGRRPRRPAAVAEALDPSSEKRDEGVPAPGTASVSVSAEPGSPVKYAHTVVQREHRDALTGGEPRIIGDLHLRFRSQTPRAALVEFDFEPRGRAGAQPCRFNQRQVALPGAPSVARAELDFHLPVKLAQAGISRLPGEYRGGHNQK